MKTAFSPDINSRAGKVALDHARYITIKAPAALTGAATVQVAHVKDPADADFAPLRNDDGTEVVIAAGASQIIDTPSAMDLRISSSLAEGANRDFLVSLQEEI